MEDAPFMPKKRKPKRAPKAYFNPHFIRSEDARPIRILSEYLYPRQQFKRFRVSHTIVFFGSSRTPPGSKYYEEARELAYRLTKWSKSLRKKAPRFIISSGGGGGIMEAANRGASEAYGASIGLNISLPTEQEPNPYITSHFNFEFHYFFMRKYWFVDLAACIIFFPGGYGTCDELFEVLTLLQTKKIKKPLPVFVYAREYWEKLINFSLFLERDMIDKEDIELFSFVNSPDEAFEKITSSLSRIYLH